jgi:hypothetical protein
MIYLKSLTTTYLIDAHRNQTQDERGIIYNYPFTDVSDSIRTGLNPQRISFTPYITNLSTIPWRDIILIGFDNVTWQKVLFMDFSFNSIPGGGVYPFTVNMLISPLRLGASHASGNKWGLASTTLANAGDHTAYAKLIYNAPRLYFPLVQNLVDFAGSSIALTNASTKVYGGVSYPANTPIFDEGFVIASNDVVSLNIPGYVAGTLLLKIKYKGQSLLNPRTILKTANFELQLDRIAQTINLVRGGNLGLNLLTANQSNAETDTTGMAAGWGTLSRTIVAGEFYAGIAGFKVVATSVNNMTLYTSTKISGLTAGNYYCFSVYAKASTALKNWYLNIDWYNAADVYLSSSDSTIVAASTSFTRLFLIGVAPATATKCVVKITLVTPTIGDILYVDNLMLEEIEDDETSPSDWAVGGTRYIPSVNYANDAYVNGRVYFIGIKWNATNTYLAVAQWDNINLTFDTGSLQTTSGAFTISFGSSYLGSTGTSQFLGDSLSDFVLYDYEVF